MRALHRSELSFCVKPFNSLVFVQCCVTDATTMVHILLDAGADVNSRDFEQWTPLHAAAACGRVSLCKCLCERLLQSC
jgi:ankyrin repeat protein